MQRRALIVQAAGAVGAQDQRCVIQRHVAALRAVLEKPVAGRIVAVVALDEFDQPAMTEDFAAKQPLSAPVEGQPAVAFRHVRPFGHRRTDDVIHQTSQI